MISEVPFNLSHFRVLCSSAGRGKIIDSVVITSGLCFLLPGGVLPLRDSQRLLEPAHGVHAELHGEPHSWHPFCVQHQARQHLQPSRHHGAVHGAVQQDPQAAAGSCSRDQMKGLPGAQSAATAASFLPAPLHQEPLQHVALEAAQGFWGFFCLLNPFLLFQSQSLECLAHFLLPSFRGLSVWDQAFSSAGSLCIASSAGEEKGEIPAQCVHEGSVSLPAKSCVRGLHLGVKVSCHFSSK